jgi:hypothetical protein
MTPAKAVPSLAFALLLLAGQPAAAAPADRSAGDLGEIDFPTSGPADARQHFLRGVLWLHSFEYADARAEFARARELAPDFAMAYWGEAMSRPWNPPCSLSLTFRPRRVRHPPGAGERPKSRR